MPTLGVEHRRLSPSRVLERAWALPLAVFAVTFVVYALSAAYSSVSGDVLSTHLASWQFARGTPYLDQIVFPPLEEHPGRDIWVVTLDNGRELVGRSPGAVALAVPAYALLGTGDFSLAPGALTAAALTATSIALFAAAVQRFRPRREAALAALALGLTTPMWSVAANGMWPHTVTTLGLCGMAWAATLPDRRRWWLVGLFGGVVLWGRLHAALIVAVLGLYVAWRERSWRPVWQVGGPSAALLVAQTAWTRWFYGSWNPVSAYNTDPFSDFAGDHRLDVVNQLGAWVSPDRGLLVWTPLVLVLAAALVRSWSSLPAWSRGLVYGGLAYSLLQGVLNRFSGGDSFYGYRLMLEFLCCLAPALALSASSMGPLARRIFAPVLALQAIAISAGAVNGELGLLHEDAWRANSFVAALGGQVWLALAVVAIAAAMGTLGRRIWNDAARTPAVDQ